MRRVSPPPPFLAGSRRPNPAGFGWRMCLSAVFVFEPAAATLLRSACDNPVVTQLDLLKKKQTHGQYVIIRDCRCPTSAGEITGRQLVDTSARWIPGMAAFTSKGWCALRQSDPLTSGPAQSISSPVLRPQQFWSRPYDKRSKLSCFTWGPLTSVIAHKIKKNDPF